MVEGEWLWGEIDIIRRTYLYILKGNVTTFLLNLLYVDKTI